MISKSIMSKLLTVFGATGNQGGSVITRVLESSELSKTWKIRGVTRDVTKPAAVALKEKGVEMVTADMDSKESLAKAVQGSAAVFGVTNFWESMSADKETQQGKNLADACKPAGVERFIFSSLPYVSKVTNGKSDKVHHFDSKARVEEYAKSIDLPGSYFMPAAFMPFMLSSFRPDKEGVYTWNVPFDKEKTKIPLIDAPNDSGLFVAAILLNLPETLNQRILGSSGYFTAPELAKTFAEVTGEKANIGSITYDQFKSFLPPAAADELAANFELFEAPGYFVGEPTDAVDKSIELVVKSGLPKPISWKDYVAKNFKKSA